MRAQRRKSPKCQSGEAQRRVAQPASQPASQKSRKVEKSLIQRKVAQPTVASPAKKSKSRVPAKSRSTQPKVEKSLHPAKSRKVKKSLAPSLRLLVSLPISQSSQGRQTDRRAPFNNVCSEVLERMCVLEPSFRKRWAGEAASAALFEASISSSSFFPTRHSASQFRNASQPRMLAGKKVVRPASKPLAGRAKIIYACGEES